MEEIAEVIGESKSQINEILAIIKTFDPAGVGASNLSECLKLQLDPSDPRYDLLYRIVDRHLDDIACNRLALVAKELKLTINETQELVKTIKKLDPKPDCNMPRKNQRNIYCPMWLLNEWAMIMWFW